jgi:hypothetical protein
MPETAEFKDPGAVLGNAEGKDVFKRNPEIRAGFQKRE